MFKKVKKVCVTLFYTPPPFRAYYLNGPYQQYFSSNNPSIFQTGKNGNEQPTAEVFIGLNFILFLQFLKYSETGL